MDAPHFAGAFLDRHDVLQPRDTGEILLAHRNAHAAGIIVQHDRQPDGTVDGDCVQRVFLLGRQGVRGRRHQNGVGGDGLGGFGVFDGVFGPRRPGADDQRQPPADHLLGISRQIETLLRRVRVILTGRSADDDAVNAGFDQVFQDGGEGLLVDLAVGGQRRHGRCVNTFESHGYFSIASAEVFSKGVSAFIPSGAINISMVSRDNSQCSKTKLTTPISLRAEIS